MTLTEFLLARIAEDEATARSAGSGAWDALDGGVTDLDAETWPVVSSEVPDGVRGDWAVRVHIARHDPARVRTECEAKRRIVERETERARRIWRLRVDEHRRTWEQWQAEWPPDTLRDLALPYADHPDYRPEWKP